MKTFLLGCLASLLTLIMPVAPFIYLVGIFILLDTFVALLYARANRTDGIPWFESHKFFNFGIKIAVYIICIIGSYGIDKVILEGNVILGVQLLVTKVLTILFITNEMVSINETYEKKYKESILKTLRRWIRTANGIKRDLKEIVNTDENESK
jgi:hypothetical protein